MKTFKTSILICLLLMSVGCSRRDDSASYKKSGTWSQTDTSYIFTVEDDEFDGDVYQAGEYYLSVIDIDDSTDAQLYDIYILDHKDYTDEELDLIEADSSVGGYGEFTDTLYLKNGDYIYVRALKDQDGTTSGTFNIQLVD